MKSMKLASGFAVSALALAIAGQTAAQETTTDVNFAGELEVRTIFNIKDETRKHTMPGYAAAEDEFSFYGVWSVSNGPFSGDLLLGLEEDEQAGSTGAGGGPYIEIDNLRVDDGPVSFGQIGRITDSAGIYEDLTDMNELDGEDTSTRLGVDAAFRYTAADLGVRVQAEADGGANNKGAFGFAASLEQDVDVATIWADVQYREDVNGAEDGMEDAVNTFGVAVEAAPVDLVTLTAVLRSNSETDTNSYAAKADLSLSETLSTYGLLTDRTMDTDDTTVLRGGLTATVEQITLEAAYEARVAELGEALVETKATYTDGAYSVFGEFNYNMENFNNAAGAGNELVAGGSYTSQSGVVYGAEYTMSSKHFHGGEAQTVEAYGNYSF